jgi:hypothetical protein
LATGSRLSGEVQGSSEGGALQAEKPAELQKRFIKRGCDITQHEGEAPLAVIGSQPQARRLGRERAASGANILEVVVYGDRGSSGQMPDECAPGQALRLAL